MRMWILLQKQATTFTVMYNPNTFSQNYRSVWIDETPQGGTAETNRTGG
jgi:hypothetical protein